MRAATLGAIILTVTAAGTGGQVRTEGDEWLKKPVDDRTFRTFLGFFAYDQKQPLDARVTATKDVDGRSLLENSMIVYGSGNADGNRHTHVNLPVILAGGGGGTLTPGRFAKFPSQPMSNLLLSMADRMGATGVQSLGDSTARVEGI